MKKILVTGGSGRLGKYLVPEFAKEYQVKVFDVQEPELKDAEFFRGDITKLEDLVKASEDVDGIVHLAAMPVYTGEDAKIMKVNVDGTFNVVEAAKQNNVKNMVFTSSVCAWGVIFWSSPFTPEYFPVDEEIRDLPDDMYGLGKLMGELLCYAYYKRYGVKAICLRLPAIVFPFEAPWIDAIKNVDNPVYGFKAFPLTLRDFMWQYVDPRDLPQAYTLALKALREGKVEYGVYNVGAADVFSTVESLELIRRYFPDVKYIKNKTSFISDKYRTLFDISKAQAELGYQPKFTWRDFNP